MKILLFGKNGQVGWELQRSLAVLGEVKALGSQEVDFTKPERIQQVISEYKPSHIVNAAAYTAVDKAEDEEELATSVNGHAVGVIAEEAKRIGASFLHYSTDYVFDGKKSSPFVETDEESPLNAYGRSKLLGEKNITQIGGNSIILRVSWVYGARGNNFLKTMLRLGSDRESLSVVDDQVGAPTWSRHIAEVSAHILKDDSFSSKKGIYHLAPQGRVSWCGFAKAIFEAERSTKSENTLKIQSVMPILAKDYPVKALRPLNSVMSSAKLENAFGLKLAHWQDSLALVINELK